jgi:poly(A) polymerase
MNEAAGAGRLEPLRALSTILADGWLVGGAVRDRLLGRSVSDFDVVLIGDAEEPARRLAKGLDAHRFRLSEGFGAWRVIARDRSWQVDLMSAAGGSIEADLARRDLTINAIAQPLDAANTELLDPYGGTADLAARRLRMVSATAFSDDPLRVMRLARHACELGFAPDGPTLAAAAQASPALSAAASERVFAELKRIVAAPAAVGGLGVMEEVGATEVVLPELAALHGIEQSHYHHLDVHDHTMLVLAETIALEKAPEDYFGDDDGEAIAALLAEPLADGLSRGEALRFGALFHDIAKPQTRAVTDSGRVTFMGHDVAGAEIVRRLFARLRSSERLAEHVAALAREHLRLGFLVHRAPLDRRAVYEYMRATEPVAVDVSVLSVADRFATRGRNSDAAIAKHIELAKSLIEEGLRWRQAPPHPPVRGDELAKAIGLAPGPRLGELLRELEQASYAGEVSSAGDAIALARELLARNG